MSSRHVSMPVGVVIRRSPGVTRWAKWAWQAVAVLPGAGPGDWFELRREGDVAEYHIGTAQLELWRLEAEAYRANISAAVPAIYAVLRPVDEDPERPYSLLLVTASPYEAQDYMNSDELVEKIPMPPGLLAWVQEFIDEHYHEEEFVKRRRVGQDMPEQDGIGDARIQQPTDVYRSPAARRKAKS